MLRRFLLSLTLGLALVGQGDAALVGPRRVLLSSGAPSWVLRANGIAAGVDLAFARGLAWQQGVGQGIPASFVTAVRASNAYEDNSAGNWTLFAPNTLRNTDKGTLVEEGRTNLIENNSMQGAAVGTPGTLPTSWSGTSFPTDGITANIVALGTENGVNYIDFTIVGTAIAGISARIPFEGTGAAASPTGSALSITESFFLKIVGGSVNNFNVIRGRQNNYNSGGSALATNFGPNVAPSITGAALGSQRFTFNATTPNLTAFTRPDLEFTWSAGAVINLTIRIGWPQLEVGDWATSPIRTTNAPAARAADVVKLKTIPGFGAALTLFASGMPNAPTADAVTQSIAAASDGTSNNRLMMFRAASTSNAGVVSATSGVATSLSSGVPWSASGKIAASTQPGSATVVFSGGTPIAGTPTAAPVGVNTIQIGLNGAATGQWNGYVTEIAAWPTTAFPAATLQMLTR